MKRGIQLNNLLEFIIWKPLDEINLVKEKIRNSTLHSLHQ